MKLFEKKTIERPIYRAKKESRRKEPPKEEPELWIKCENCATPLFRKQFIQNLKVCEKCNHHHKLFAHERLDMLVDRESFIEHNRELEPCDPLNFGREYTNKLEEDQKRTNQKDAIITGEGLIGGHSVMLGIMDFHFRGGSMGSVVGEKVARLFESAIEKRKPLIIVTSSGGARMQEGVLALMQMAKTSSLAVLLSREKLPYIVVLTDPTTGGVSASFAALGDIIIGEPNAIIGFSGPRVIEQTIRQKLPQGFQSSEFYLAHGFIDQVVQRKDLKNTVIKILNFFTQKQAELDKDKCKNPAVISDNTCR